MSIIAARIMAHLVVGGIVLMALGLIGATFVALFKSAFRVPARKSKISKEAEGFTFQVAGQETIKPPRKRKLFSLRVFRNAKQQPMAIPLQQKTDRSLDWSPVLSPAEEKTLFIPTFQRLKHMLQETPKTPETQLEVRSDSATAEPAQQEIAEDLFEQKDIFQLEPDAATT